MTLREQASTFHLSVSHFGGVSSFRDYFVLTLLFFLFFYCYIVLLALRHRAEIPLILHHYCAVDSETTVYATYTTLFFRYIIRMGHLNIYHKNSLFNVKCCTSL